MNKNLFFFVLLLLAAVCHVPALAQQKPTIKTLSFADYSFVQKVSDNGKWGVAQPGSSDAAKSAKAKLVNLSNYTSIELQTQEELVRDGACSASDVSDDGNIVVGSYLGKPAYYNKAQGKWINLPMPKNYDASGNVNAVSADGHYAVGLVQPNNEYIEKAVAWDLTTGKIWDLPNLPTKDLSGTNQQQTRLTDISGDGKTILGIISVSYPGSGLGAFIYDVDKQESRFVGFKSNGRGGYTPLASGLAFIDTPVLSPNGKWVSGLAYVVSGNTEYKGGFRLNVATDAMELYTAKEDEGIIAMAVDNNGNVFGATPADNPIREMQVRSSAFWYPFADVLSMRYGLDFKSMTNFDNTGSPFTISGDGRVLSVMVDPQYGESYILNLNEDASEMTNGINLLRFYTPTPADGSAFTRIINVSLLFSREIKVSGEKNAVMLKDENGKVVRSSISFAVDNGNSNQVLIQFRPTTLEAGKKYTVEIPAGTISVVGDDSKTNDKIVLNYTGRADKPLEMVSVRPESGSEQSYLDYSYNPVVIKFDGQVVKSDTAKAELWRTDDNVKIADLTTAYKDSSLAVYPAARQYLYKGANYKVVVYPGAVTDISGYGANEKIELTYKGLYERSISTNDSTLFSCNFDDMSESIYKFMRYEGDHNTPTTEMQGWEFDADNQPWNFSIRETATSTDFCAASTSMYSPAGKSDDWMVIPQIEIPDQYCSLSFKGQSYKNGKTDKLKIIVWQSEQNVSTLTKDVVDKIKAEGKVVFDQQLKPGANEDKIDGEWTDYNVDLSAYSGKKIYIAFVNENENQSCLFVNDLAVNHNMQYFLSLTNAQTVVNKQSVKIAGSLTANSAEKTYSSVSLTLNDASGNAVSTFSKTGLSLKKGDKVAFEFDKELPLTVGETNNFTIGVKLDNYTDVAESYVKNLAFEPKKRVVLEEMTGTTCVNCPLGILAIEEISKQKGDQFIPVSVHTYTGDQLGAGLTGYTTSLGLSGAPTGVVNRNGVISSPMWESPYDAGYHFSNEDDHDTWLDFVNAELDIPAEADIDASVSLSEDKSKMTIPVKVSYAVNAKNLNLNLFVNVMEDGINSFQQNKYGTSSDPNLGDWGKGGKYSADMNHNIIHNDVVRAYYGSVEGTANMLPQNVEAGKTYTATFTDLEVPGTITDLTKAKVLVMLLDGATGKTINAIVAKFPGYVSGIDGVADDDAAAGFALDIAGGAVNVSGDNVKSVAVYSVAGTALGSASGSNVSVSTNGYRGAAIVRIVNGNKVVVKKVLVK